MFGQMSTPSFPTLQQSVRGYSTTSYRGVSVPSGNGSYGSWVTPTSALRTQDCFGVLLHCASAGTNWSGVNRPIWLDLGIDYSGGTSYTPLIEKIQIGNPLPANLNGYRFYFPIFIPVTAAIAFRAQMAGGTTGVLVAAHFAMSPNGLQQDWCGTYAETIGATSASLGTTFTPGNNSKGSWASLGTTTTNLKYFQLGCHVNNATTNGEVCYLDLAYGDGTNYTPIIENQQFATIGTGELYGMHLMPPEACYADVPAGSTLYVRGACSNSPDSGYHATAYGIGG